MLNCCCCSEKEIFLKVVFNVKLLSYILVFIFIKDRESTSVVAKSVPSQELCVPL